MLGMFCVRGALGWLIALLGGKAGCLLVACEGILPIPVELAGKLPGIPPEKATELTASPAMAIKLTEIIFFICITLLLGLVKYLTPHQSYTQLTYITK
jgi:hypothetical protein